MIYTLQVSNHREAGQRVPTAAASESWQTIYDGPIASPVEARRAVDEMSAMYRHVRLFRGGDVGKLFYAVLRPGM